MDKKIAEIKQEADKQQARIDHARQMIEKNEKIKEGLHPKDPQAVAAQKQIDHRKERLVEPTELLKIYQKELNNLENKKADLLKKKEKVTETYNEKVDEDSAKKLKEFL
ncbi:MAG: hypothetical protein Q4B28_02990 [bacterium]|nr:hypothetical protein [bacterium]